MEKITQTAGRDQLGDFAPDFAHYSDDILFGEKRASGTRRRRRRRQMTANTEL